MAPETFGSGQAGPIQFTINGKTHTLSPDVPPSTTLVNYLRDYAHLPGTKALCHEGGCGVCTAVATKFDLELNAQRTFSFKSCQTLVHACVGWDIETIENVGNSFKGYHPIQKAITGFYGTQCGYCTPGFIMTMYGEMKSLGKVTTEQVEKSLDGNLCRCTGYRPILDSFKSLAKDSPPKLAERLVDIEESYKNVCPTTGKKCTGSCQTKKSSSASKILLQDISLSAGKIHWYRPVSLEGLFKVINSTSSEDNIRLVVGNTGQGVFKNDGPYNVYIDTTGVSDLFTVAMRNPLKIGANVNLARCIEIFHQSAKDYPEYQHLEAIAKHWEFVANVGVRNIASWCGNLSMKKQHNEFPSDVFLTLASLDTKLQISSAKDGSTEDISVEEYLKTDMSKKFISSMTIPPQKDIDIRTYKITQRAVNSHAYINAAFRFHLDKTSKCKVLSQPALYFGGVRPDFIRATKTERYLVGKQLGMTGVVKAAAKILETELRPDTHPEEATPKYRLSLSQSLLYKAVLDLAQDEVGPEYTSGGPIIVRPLSSGKQTFEENKDSWPIGQPVPKLESDLQVSGTAQYLNDMASFPHELHGAFVQTTQANAELDEVDATEALRMNGVVDFVTYKDIKGRNSSAPTSLEHPEPLFVEKKIYYAGQAVGLIVAKTRDIALEAVKKVKVTYKNVKKPILTIPEALKYKNLNGPETVINIDNTGGNDVPKPDHTITGIMQQGTQFHLHMEPLSALVRRSDRGFEVWATTQWKTTTQNAVAEVMDISTNKIDITVRRLGGAYGAKITRGNMVACAAAVACQKLDVPVRIVLPLTVNMTLAGWREPFYSEYKVGFSKDGLLRNVEVLYVADAGYADNETSASHSSATIPSAYYSDKWKITSKIVNTHTAVNVSCRTPGNTEAIATIENIMEHVADYLKRSSIEIREINFVTTQKRNEGGYGPRAENLAATKIFPKLKVEYEERRTEVDNFNQKNRWRKKGLAMIPMCYTYNYPPFRYSVQVAIYEHDGTIAISHGGIEMGQGINTKVAQMVAKVLDVPLEIIEVKASNNFVAANSMVTGGSYGSDLCAHGADVCAKKIKSRLDSISKNMENSTGKKPAWKELIKKCMAEDVDLSERYWTAVSEHPKGYDIFGGCLVEVELDVLTGQFLIRKANVIEDVGKSMSPFIDIGQVEGSIIMGFGFFTSEVLRYNKETGEKLSNSTWQYKVPTALDIPVEFDVGFLPNAKNPFGVVGSKGAPWSLLLTVMTFELLRVPRDKLFLTATGEPALCLSYSIVIALRDAVKSARADAGDYEWFNIDPPLTIEKIQQLCKVDPIWFDLQKNQIFSKNDMEEFCMIDKKEAEETSNCSVN